MTISKNFSPKQKVFFIFSFAVLYQVFLAIVLAHVFDAKGLLYYFREPWPTLFFYIFVYFAPVVWAFFNLPISATDKKNLAGGVLSIVYIIVMPVAIFITGVVLKSSVRPFSAEGLCLAVRGEWQEGYAIDAALGQLDGIMQGQGAKFSSAWGIEKGFIAYQFERQDEQEVSLGPLRAGFINLTKEKEAADFLYQHRLYVARMDKAMTVENNVVRIELKAGKEGFAALKDFEKEEAFKSPPPWMQAYMNENHLAFRSRECRGEFSYVYSYDIRGIWGKIFDVKNYVEITVDLSGAIEEDGKISNVRLENLTCRAPFWKASWGYGPPPSRRLTYPPYPSLI